MPSPRQRLRRTVVVSRSLDLTDRARALASAASELARLAGEGPVSLAMPQGAERLDRVLGQSLLSGGLGAQVMRAIYAGDVSGLNPGDLDRLERLVLKRLTLLRRRG